MRNPAGEIPQIVFLHVGDKTLAVPIDGRDPRRPVKHDGPFAGRVPMQLPNASGRESHVYARQGLGDGQFPNSHLPRPSAFVSPLVRKRERILEVLNQALGIRGGWPGGIRVLCVQTPVCRTRISCAPVTPWVGSRLVFLRHSAAYRQTASRSSQGSRAESKKSATRELIFGAVILHCA